MRYIAPLLCLCAVSALGAVLESPKMGGAVATALPVEADTKMAGTPAMQVAKAVPIEADTKMAGTPAMHVAKAVPVEADTKMAGTPVMPVLEPVSMKSANPWTTYDNLEVLSLHLSKSDDAKLKPELEAAFNLTAELQNWKKMGLPEALPFYNDQNNIAYGYMTIDTPVPALYADNIAHEIAPKFHFFNMYDPKDIEGKIVTNVNNLKSYGWDENLPVKFLVHGYLNSIRAPMMQSLKNAYLKSGKYNVMGVNWGDLAGGWLGLGSYAWARGNVPTVAARISMMVDNLIEKKLTEAKKVHIIGHSLGAHVAGIAGKNMRVAQIGRITGLDPAKPLFELTEVPGRIHHTDADLVDIIHTNAGMLGRSDLLGSIDFYPNGGSSQINCKFDVFGPCAHARAYELFEKSILNNSLDGVRCDGLPGLESGRKCLARMGRNEPTVTATMGDKMAFTRGGSYFVEYSWP